MQGNHVGMLDAVAARDLLHHQLRVGEHRHLCRPLRKRIAQGVDEGLVLRYVVAGPPEVAVELGQGDAVRRGDVDAERRIAGIAPAGPVDVDAKGVGQGSTTVTGTGGS